MSFGALDPEARHLHESTVDLALDDRFGRAKFIDAAADD
jgi:hypothetical protein